MPSSISDFSPFAGRAFVLLLSALLGYLMILEVAARTVIPRISALEHRQSVDLHNALSLRPTMRDGSKSVLIVGNSLLLDGIDRERLRRLMGSQYYVALLPIESTTYLDWYFGLRRLTTDGARPASIVLCLTAAQVLSNTPDQERFAYSLMRFRDTFEVAKAAGLKLTATSDYFFANLSAWLGLRASFRNAVLQKWLPHASELADVLALRATHATTLTPRDAQKILSRLEAMRSLARAAGAEFVFLVPPLLTQDGLWTAVRADAASVGIPVLIPLSSAEVSSQDFSDGFHLNTTGAALFTDRVAPELRGTLGAMAR